MSTASATPHSTYQRLRLRFRKDGDLRWISHRDLVRAMERLCRRAGLALRMSEGFHPKAKLSFPSALALGMVGQSEVLELDLVTPVDPLQLPGWLNALAPSGLTITQVTTMPPGQRKARVVSMLYEFRVPDAHREQVEATITAWEGETSLPIHRGPDSEPIDILADLQAIRLGNDGLLRFRLRATDGVSARPRDVLQALGLAELEQSGHVLTRSDVEVTP